jgi:uncharacterized protein with GYD domain
MRRYIIALSTAMVVQLTLISDSGLAQQAVPTVYRYLIRAEVTQQGMKDFHKQSPTEIGTIVKKFAESMGGKLDAWYFNEAGTTAYGIIECTGQIAPSEEIDVSIKINSVEIAIVTMTPLITAQDAEKVVAKMLQGTH